MNWSAPLEPHGSESLCFERSLVATLLQHPPDRAASQGVTQIDCSMASMQQQTTNRTWNEPCLVMLQSDCCVYSRCCVVLSLLNATLTRPSFLELIFAEPAAESGHWQVQLLLVRLFCRHVLLSSKRVEEGCSFFCTSCTYKLV